MKKAYMQYTAALLLFGSNGIVASHISLSSDEIVLTRTGIGALFLTAVFLLSRRERTGKINKRHLGCLLLSGGAMGASWIFLFEAYERVGVSLATLLYYCGPVLVMVLSAALLHERIGRVRVMGIMAILLGMLLVNGAALIDGGISLGLICGMLAAVMYAAMVFLNKLAYSITGLKNATCQLWAAFALVAGFTAARGDAQVSSISDSLGPILLLGTVNTGIGCYLYFSSIQSLPAGSVAICGYLEPLSALLFSAIILQERLSPMQILGAVLILGGAAAGEWLSQRLTSSARA